MKINRQCCESSLSKLCVADRVGYGAYAGSSDPAALVRELLSLSNEVELQQVILPVGMGLFLLVDGKAYLARVNKECVGWLYYEQ